MDQRLPLVVANWKMNKTPSEAATLVHELVDSLEGGLFNQLDLVLCPPYVSLPAVSSVLHEQRFVASLGAQDVYPAVDGAYTGSVNARMLADLGVEYCIVGHSERRHYFAETDSDAALRIAALSAEEINPILCVGEDLPVRQAGSAAAIDFVMNQLRACLKQASAMDVVWEGTGLVIAYEPIWSIGSGRTATPGIVQAMASAIRDELSDLLGERLSFATRIIYGGSVNAENARVFANLPDIDGCLVGGVSLDAERFASLIRSFVQTRATIEILGFTTTDSK